MLLRYRKIIDNRWPTKWIEVYFDDKSVYTEEFNKTTDILLACCLRSVYLQGSSYVVFLPKLVY